MIGKIRKKLPAGLRLKLKEMTGKYPILTFFIALSYGFLLKPYQNPWIRGKGIPMMFVKPDIYAVDCAIDIFIKQVYERFYKLKEGDIVVDVGANVGMFTVKAALSVGDKGKVVSIEPIEENFELLKKNVEFHNLVNVQIIRKALGSRRGKTTMLKSLLSGTHQLKGLKNPEFPIEEVDVEVDTLDNIVKELSINKIDLLKIDVEGAELEVLKGAEESLKITRNIAMELHDSEKEVKRFLEQRGFEVIIEGSMLYAKKIQ